MFQKHLQRADNHAQTALHRDVLLTKSPPCCTQSQGTDLIIK